MIIKDLLSEKEAVGAVRLGRIASDKWSAGAVITKWEKRLLGGGRVLRLGGGGSRVPGEGFRFTMRQRSCCEEGLTLLRWEVRRKGRSV